MTSTSLPSYSDLGFRSNEQYQFPTIVNVCVQKGICPCSCSHCPVGLLSPKERSLKYGNTNISMDIYKMIISEMSYIDHTFLRIHGVGEPLAWSGLAEALKYTHEHEVKCWIFTCLVTRNREMLRTLARYCNIIEVSINSITPADYMKTKGKDYFAIVVDNLNYLKDFCQEELLTSRIIVSRVESDDSGCDEEFVDYWEQSGLVDDAFIRSYHDYNSILDSKHAEVQRAVRCLVHWNRFNIDCSGQAVICFNELFRSSIPSDDVVLGNVFDQTIQDIWQGDRLRVIRLAQLKNDYTVIDFSQELPCQTCTSCQPFDPQSGQTSEYQIRQLED